MNSSVKYIKPKKASQALGVSTVTLRNWANSGYIDYILTHGGRLYDVSTVHPKALEELSKKDTPSNKYYIENNSAIDIKLINNTTCDYCKQSFSEDDYVTHLSICEKRKLMFNETNLCKFCNNIFINDYSLKLHQKNAKYCIDIQKKMHTVNVSKTSDKICCTYCDVTFLKEFFDKHSEECVLRFKALLAEKENIIKDLEMKVFQMKIKGISEPDDI
jgi:predicted site-specific integrase-resolvase